MVALEAETAIGNLNITEQKLLVILEQDEYKHKINNFIHNDRFTTVNINPTQHF
jgi:hypothetical protein